MEFLDNHRAAAQDCLEPGKRLEAEAAVYLCANLDALYYDLLQYHLRRGGEGPAVPPSHKYFPAVAAKHPGEQAGCLASRTALNRCEAASCLCPALFY